MSIENYVFSKHKKLSVFNLGLYQTCCIWLVARWFRVTTKKRKQCHRILYVYICLNWYIYIYIFDMIMIYIIVSIHVYTCHLFFAISQQWGFLNLTEVTVSIFPARSSNLGFNSGHGPFGRSGPSRASCWYRHEATSLGFDFKLLKNIVDVTPSIFKHELFSMIFSPFISNVTQ